MRFLFQTIIIASLVLFSCRKDKNLDLPDYSHVAEIPGGYSGDNHHTYYGWGGQGWVLYDPTIIENNYHSVLINYWSSGIGNVVMEVEGSELKITDQIDTITSYGMGGAYFSQYLLKLNASGTYYSESNSIYLDYTEETAPLGSNDFDTSKVGYISISK